MNASTPQFWKGRFALVSWIGIALDLGLVLGLLFAAPAVGASLGATCEPITWMQLCGELLLLITIFTIWPARDVDRYRPHAWIAAVVSRGSSFLLLTTCVFVFGAPKGFLLGAALDFVIGALQVGILVKLQEAERGAPPVMPGGANRPWAPSAPTPARGTEEMRLRTVYRWVACIGIGANMLFVLPLVFVPHVMLRFLNVGGEPVAWAQEAGLLLGIISVFYIPALFDLDRFRPFAWLAIFPSRAFGVLFTFIAVLFLGANDAFLLGVVLDLPFAVAQTFILGRIEKIERKAVLGRNPPWFAACWRQAAAVLALIVIFASVAWHKLLRVYPQQLANDSMEEYFKHGSIGAEDAAGLPYWIWITLPNVFPEYLPKPGGYASLGFVWEPGAELPIGFSRKKIGFDRVAINCALCHSGSVQIPGAPRPISILGAPATTANPLLYQRFLFRSANDPRFNSSTLMPAIARQTDLSWLDKLIYEYVLIPATRKSLREQAKKWDWTYEKDRPEWGPGRIEPFNPVKVAILESVDPNVTVGATLGTSDMQPLWQMARYPGESLHWDGLNTDLREVVDSSALGDGAIISSVPHEKLREIQEWISQLKPPAYPFTTDLHPELVTTGSEVYMQDCARCHAPGGEFTGKVMPASGPDGVGTDDNRALMWTKESAAAYNAYLGNRWWRFRNFRSTGGYVNVPLDGLWLRAPYLHNGSVPTLVDLLKPPAERPTAFLRGLNDYDTLNVGFVSHSEYPGGAGGRDADPAKYGGFRYETSGRGNSNAGHLYGTDLPEADKAALIEFLKTL